MLKETVYIVYQQTDLFMTMTMKVFRLEQDAKDYCEMQNQLHKPEFDDWGYCGGVYHNFYSMEVE